MNLCRFFYNYPYNEFYHENTPARAKQLAASLGRGRLQIDILEATDIII